MEFIEFVKSLFGSKKTGNGLDELKAEIAKLEGETQQTGRPGLPDAPKYDRVDYTPPDDDALAERAREELKEWELASKNAVENQAETAKEALEKQKSATADKAASQQKAVDTAYDRADKQTSDDVLKRGVARSSIAVNRMADLSEARAGEQAAVRKAYADAVAGIETELGGLEAKRQQALDQFNIALAAKLSTRIDQLKDERAERQAEALKYNNSLTEKEAAYEIDKAMKESDLYSEQLSQTEKEKELEKKYGTETEKRYRAAYEKMRDTLGGLSKSEAKALVRDDPFFADNLSQYWFYKLYDEFGR